MPKTGLEPARLSTLAPETSASTNSAIWARVSDLQSTADSFVFKDLFRKLKQELCPAHFYRAANETRTRDPNLGKVVLYQLSYCRRMLKNIALIRKRVQRYCFFLTWPNLLRKKCKKSAFFFIFVWYLPKNHYLCTVFQKMTAPVALREERPPIAVRPPYGLRDPESLTTNNEVVQQRSGLRSK